MASTACSADLTAWVPQRPGRALWTLIRLTFVRTTRREVRGELGEIAAREHGFHGVADPYFDLHPEKALTLLRPMGVYLTCGFAGQTPAARDAVRTSLPATGAVLGHAIQRNISIQGNCLGVREDLDRALAAYAAGVLPIVVDSVFRVDDFGPFLDRTFNDPHRFGNVVVRLDPATERPPEPSSRR